MYTSGLSPLKHISVFKPELMADILQAKVKLIQPNIFWLKTKKLWFLCFLLRWRNSPNSQSYILNLPYLWPSKYLLTGMLARQSNVLLRCACVLHKSCLKTSSAASFNTLKTQNVRFSTSLTSSRIIFQKDNSQKEKVRI